jgi:hypothetical protein
MDQICLAEDRDKCQLSVYMAYEPSQFQRSLGTTSLPVSLLDFQKVLSRHCRCVVLTIHPFLAPRSRMSRAITLLPF